MKASLRNAFKVLGVILLVAVIIVGYLFRVIGKKPDAQAYNAISYYSEGRFVSPTAYISVVPKVYVSHSEIPEESAGWARSFLKSPNAPKTALPKVMLSKSDFPETPDPFSVYWLGHSSAIVELNGVRMLIDPVFGNAAPFPGMARRYDESPLKRDELPDVDFVIITHNHYDHLEYATMRFLRKKNVRFIVPLGVDVILKGWGIPEEKISTLGWNEPFNEKGVKITALPAVHHSGRSGFGGNATLWASYVLSDGEKKIYWSGDSGYGTHFDEAGTKYGPFDLVCIGIDGWDPKWPSIHLFPEEVIQACFDLRTTALLPIHWAVFDLALHPWNESIQKVIDLAQEKYINTKTPMWDESLQRPVLIDGKAYINVTTPMMGEKIIPKVTQTKHWW